MYYDVVDAKYVEGYKIAVVFENGRKGAVDLKGYAGTGGVFSRFSDLEYFKKFYVNREMGVLCWPEGGDIAPESLYHEATGEPLPEWMRPEDGRKEAV
ncbi:MAG: DUF2442 domain-containing protein [Deltaproteobacteria bacterium]|nr:DUF2442 domain-containing protein [Deltaproteobacteria bacterium]